MPLSLNVERAQLELELSDLGDVAVRPVKGTVSESGLRVEPQGQAE
ncbi:MAG TPA: hypothetical protein VMG12_03215 [Polyangiaceae bacterium]|nr:hypothetical protein [Polyangiaceae bacterium]